ncbi:hypothetical protein BC628DRAFT_1407026 [Trametes gibbosa]|nr:hypothetical protein BC628DRAFT_1407026 [Trametes gibbosa]
MPSRPSKGNQYMAPRPGPLMPLPLDLFKADSPLSGTPAKHPRPNKRPHSPGLGCIDSPAKRRIKAAEGAVGMRHTRSPLSASSHNARSAPSHFHALLQGPESPAKKLDFGSTKPAGSSSTTSESMSCDVSRSGTRPSRRSPKMISAPVRRSSRLSARASSAVPESLSVTEQPAGVASSVRGSPLESMLILRTGTSPDIQSIHYPGFDIYQDPHITLPSSSTPQSTSADEAFAVNDCEKENFQPRRKSSKKVANLTTPSETSLIKMALLSPSSTNVLKPVPASPHPKHVCDYLSAAHTTPKERILRTMESPLRTLVISTPGRTPLGKEERKQMRRALEVEVDDFDGDDDL